MENMSLALLVIGFIVFWSGFIWYAGILEHAYAMTPEQAEFKDKQAINICFSGGVMLLPKGIYVFCHSVGIPITPEGEEIGLAVFVVWIMLHVMVALMIRYPVAPQSDSQRRASG